MLRDLHDEMMTARHTERKPQRKPQDLGKIL